MGYESPKLTEVGSLHELTLSDIYKTTGVGDVIHINNISLPVPGGTVTNVS